MEHEGIRMSETASVRPPIDLNDALGAIVDRYHPERVILFGSYAYGSPAEESDIDLLVVTEHPPAAAEWHAVAYEVGQRSTLPLQLVFMSVEVFNETKDVVGGIAYPAHRWGKVLYHAHS
jgi:predicted nucleotidyltransferase